MFQFQFHTPYRKLEPGGSMDIEILRSNRLLRGHAVFTPSTAAAVLATLLGNLSVTYSVA
jgi:hypothetical protein